jgi:hypothetical protein
MTLCGPSKGRSLPARRDANQLRRRPRLERAALTSPAFGNGRPVEQPTTINRSGARGQCCETTSPQSSVTLTASTILSSASWRQQDDWSVVAGVRCDSVVNVTGLKVLDSSTEAGSSARPVLGESDDDLPDPTRRQRMSRAAEGGANAVRNDRLTGRRRGRWHSTDDRGNDGCPTHTDENSSHCSPLSGCPRDRGQSAIHHATAPRNQQAKIVSAEAPRQLCARRDS